MSENNGAVSPNDDGTPDAALSDAAIDAALDNDQPIAGDETHKLAQEFAELKQQLRAKDEVIFGLRGDLSEIKKMAAEQIQYNKELVGGMRDAKDRGYNYERERLEGIQRKAASEADVATFDEAARALKALDQQRTTAEPKGQQKQDKPAADSPAQQQTPPDPAVAAWVAENPWINDRKMHREAMAIEANVLEDKPYLSTVDRLKEVKAEMAKRHPDKFQNPARNQPPAVSRPGPQTAKPKPKDLTIADLDEDSKAALAAIKRVDPKFTDQMYLKERQKRIARQKEINRL